MRHARTRAAAAAVALIALLAGCAAPATSPTAAPTASDAAPTAEAPTPAVTPTADPMADWQLIRPESGRTQFRIPVDWSADVTFEEFGGDPSDSVIVRRPDGQQQLRFSQAPGDVGGVCVEEGADGISTPAPAVYELLDTAPIAPGATPGNARPVFGAVALELDDGQWLFGMGITGEEGLQEPLGCPFYFITGGPGELGGLLTFATQSQLAVEPDGAPWIVGSIEEARAYLETDEYATIKQVLLSLEYRV